MRKFMNGHFFRVSNHIFDYKLSPYSFMVYSYEDLPLMLSVPDVAEVLGIARAGAYELTKSEGFPAIRIGSRIIVPKEDFIAWIKAKTVESN